jgi:5-(carboxyamino)imidazole ribonucleotide synthase
MVKGTRDLYSQSFGIIGSGQLGRMLAYRASLLGFIVNIYSDKSQSPASVFANSEVVGSYDDSLAINKFINENDFATSEFENITTKNLDSKINPNPSAIFTCQNRLREKTLARSLGIKTPVFIKITNKDDAKDFFAKEGSFILKTTEFGYDGKGQCKITDQVSINSVSFNDKEYIAESFIDFHLEFSVILTRGNDGHVVFYPSPINKHKDGILIESLVSKAFNEQPFILRAKEYASLIAKSLNYKGTMAVEFFLTKDKEIIFNEIAPRPHNSAHYTMDLCNVCQFENHIRAVADKPMLTPVLLQEGKMINLIGNDTIDLLSKYEGMQNAKIHLYGKSELSKGRKIGHINILDL